MKRKGLTCSKGGRGMLSNERCCSQNNQGLHFAVCSYLMYSVSCGNCCNKTIWASHWRALAANIFHRPKDSLRGLRNSSVSCAAHLVQADVNCRGRLLSACTHLRCFTNLQSYTKENFHFKMFVYIQSCNSIFFFRDTKTENKKSVNREKVCFSCYQPFQENAHFTLT